MNDGFQYKTLKVRSKTSFLSNAEFKVFEGSEFMCLLATYQEPTKPIHMMTVYYEKDAFEGFEQEIEFFVHSITNSSFRTTWTVLKEGNSFIDMNKLGLEHDHLNHVQ